MALPLALATSVLVVAPVHAASAGEPTVAEARFELQRAHCAFDDDTGRWVAVGRVRSTVNTVPKASAEYYQKVGIRIDHAEVGSPWRKLESRNYSWSKFRAGDLPTYSTSGVRSVVGPSIVATEVLSVKYTVTLKQTRPGPDKTVWRYKRRSGSFVCPVETGPGETRG